MAGAVKMNWIGPDESGAPCPFCGAHEKLLIEAYLRDGYESSPNDPDALAWVVRCPSCSAEGGWAKIRTGAIRNWRLRQIHPADRAAMQAARDALMGGWGWVAEGDHPATLTVDGEDKEAFRRRNARAIQMLDAQLSRAR